MADAEHMAACDYVGLVSAHKVLDKLEKSGFTTVKSAFVNAPIINEFPMTLECVLTQVINGSKFIGEIKNVSVDENILDADGKIDLNKFHPITYDAVIKDIIN